MVNDQLSRIQKREIEVKDTETWTTTNTIRHESATNVRNSERNSIYQDGTEKSHRRCKIETYKWWTLTDALETTRKLSNYM